jgi:hypothetical protein
MMGTIRFIYNDVKSVLGGVKNGDGYGGGGIGFGGGGEMNGV